MGDREDKILCALWRHHSTTYWSLRGATIIPFFRIGLVGFHNTEGHIDKELPLTTISEDFYVSPLEELAIDKIIFILGTMPDTPRTYGAYAAQAPREVVAFRELNASCLLHVEVDELG